MSSDPHLNQARGGGTKTVLPRPGRARRLPPKTRSRARPARIFRAKTRIAHHCGPSLRGHRMIVMVVTPWAG